MGQGHHARSLARAGLEDIVARPDVVSLSRRKIDQPEQERARARETKGTSQSSLSHSLSLTHSHRSVTLDFAKESQRRYTLYIDLSICLSSTGTFLTQVSVYRRRIDRAALSRSSVATNSLACLVHCSLFGGSCGVRVGSCSASVHRKKVKHLRETFVLCICMYIYRYGTWLLFH